MPDGDTVERLRAAGAATVYEAAGRVGAIDAGIQLLASAETIAGRALPVRCHPGDNLAVHLAIASAAPGDVLVVDGGGVAVGYLGDVLASAALARGAVAAVIDGGARDVSELVTLGFPVWARARAISGASKATPGTVGEAIVCGGVAVSPTDWVVADADGVVVVADQTVERTLERAEQRLASEDSIRQRLKAGETTLDLMNLRPALGEEADALLERLRSERSRIADERDGPE